MRISGEIELGPLEEKSATVGAGTDFPILVLAGFICNGGKLYGPEYERQLVAIPNATSFQKSMPLQLKLYLFGLIINTISTILAFNKLILKV